MQRFLSHSRLRIVFSVPKNFPFYPLKPFSSSSCVSIVYQKWTAAEDRKILELHHQGLTSSQIALQMPDRTPENVSWRLRQGRRDAEPRSTRERWTPEQDALLMGKRDAGLEMKQICQFFPGRSLSAVRARNNQLLRGGAQMAKHRNGRKPWRAWSPEQKQRLIDMKVTDGLSIEAISKNLGRTYSATQYIWNKCRQSLPADVVKRLRPEHGWTSEEDDILIELRGKGVPYNEIALDLPERSTRSIKDRCQRIRKLIPRTRHARASETQIVAIRRALQPVLDGKTTFEEAAREFASSPRHRLKNVLIRMRKGAYKTELPPPSNTTASD